ncbi:sigma-70 family RNA polymerase sigma factor [Kibdelosporangium philippinense]|uniref:Sigma-70 family RNA polymerase sigma factor n=1 Tax=Kibdelosporangium philippinense TaxID=211113 RepID=A0ABS8ZAU7_9PSEU|nr:sigma-70 family RNA polymerase sigma factor [Kibdelosporangium philippinense]MCE7004995.1 sigma-70 family RNA polymerase sigma factor [Kibdelosporangium philippinense]
MTATGNPALDAGEEFHDRDLLAALRAGEDAAFGELFSRHADAVRRLARSLAADRADAEDLTAEAFFRVLQAIRRGSGPVDNVRSYLLIVTRRVAWEWSERRRDVPVSDEVLSHRAGENPDTSGQAHERNLITRAFTSLPERWRSVLWKVEVEGEQPAVVADNFGLSPNATAALARRARRGLRAAYLQAHLSTHHGSTGCRSVLEKLGAYTAGTIKGAERRRVRAHLVSCSSCQSTHDELVDVCAGLRSYAGMMAAPVALGGLVAHKTGFWATLKGLVASTGAKLTLAGSSVIAAGVLGMNVVPGADSTILAALDFTGQGPSELVITESVLPEMGGVAGALSSSLRSTGTARAAAPQDSEPAQDAPAARQADSAPVSAHETETMVVPGDTSGRPRDIADESENGSSVLIGPPETCPPPTSTTDKTLASETETTTVKPTPSSSQTSTKKPVQTTSDAPEPAAAESTDKPTR